MINLKFRTAALLVALGQSVFGFAYAEQLHVDSNRIVTAGGSITEIMYELGLGTHIVAVDTSSFYPPKAASLPKVGYFRSLAAEGIMSLDPDMLVAARGAGPDVVLEQIEALGVNVKTYEQSKYTLDSWKALIGNIGSDFDKSNAAEKLISRVTKSIDNHQATREFTDKNINAIALLSIGQRGPIAAGKNTVPNLLMQLAGVNNAANALEGYKPFSTELLAEQKIDMLLVPSLVVEGLGGKDAICKNQIIKMATSNRCNLFIMDGLLLMGFGARIDQATGELIRFANGV